jgi:hypothetical protein
MNVSEVNMIAWIVRNVTRKGRAMDSHFFFSTRLECASMTAETSHIAVAARYFILRDIASNGVQCLRKGPAK